MNQSQPLRLRPEYVLGAIALCAIAFWPVYHSHQLASSTTDVAPSPVFTQAPVTPDYLQRNKYITFYERRVATDPQDQISLDTLSQQYLQRYRETGDIGDVIRAEATARRSLAAQKIGNIGAIEAIASAQLTLHKFKDALATVETARIDQGASRSDIFAREAGLYMELGRYDRAKDLLERIPPSKYENVEADTVKARYDELTGNLAKARVELQRAQRQQDSIFDAPAVSRAWYHERQGEMAFHAGNTAEALQDERDALRIFPTFAMANNALAKFSLAAHDPKTAYRAAAAGAAVVPLPETLGYEADAAAELGRADEARQLRDTIYTVERIGNTYHTSDRLLAVYYSEHGLKTQDAVDIARREILVRGDEIYAQDTLAWALYAASAFKAADAAEKSALRFGTEDAMLDYHQGAIAYRLGDTARAKQYFELALRRNPHFHPVYADEARKSLRALGA